MDLSRLLPDAILHSRADAIIATDREGRIVFWNAGATRIFGFQADEAVGTSLDLIIPEQLRARHWRGYHQVMESGHSRYGEGEVLSVPALTKQGRRISVEFTVVMLFQDDRAIGIAAIMRDVTQRFEEIKALRQKVAALESTIATV